MKGIIALIACASVLAFAQADARAEDECHIVASGTVKGFKGSFDGVKGGLIGPDATILDFASVDTERDYLEGAVVRGDRVAACFNRALLLLEEFCENNKRASFELHGAYIGDATLAMSSHMSSAKKNKWGLIRCSNGRKTVHFRSWDDMETPDVHTREIPIRCFKHPRHAVDDYLF